MNHDPATLAFYAREAKAYAARDRTASRDLLAFLAMLEPSAQILDLGCGGGHDALAMERAGFRVLAQDGCPELAAEAERILSRAVRVQLFEDLGDACAFDAVWANASLLHAPKKTLPDLFARIHRALKPGGLLYASFKSGGSEGRDSLGRYYNRPSKDELADSLGPDWKNVQITGGKGGGYDGVATDWLAICARKLEKRPLAAGANPA